MTAKLQNIKWKLYNFKKKKLLLYGLSTGRVQPYSDELIEKLRTVYYGGIPASIILLNDGISNGYCYDRATLLAQAFFDTNDDIQLIYADIDGLKLNPDYDSTIPLYADHCILERITKDGRHLIYDTSSGFIYDKDFYWKIENPVVRKVNNKESIKRFIYEDEDYHPTNLENDKYASLLILPLLESSYNRPNEMYACKGIELLQREIECYKKIINYNDLEKEVDEDMRRLGFKK